MATRTDNDLGDSERQTRRFAAKRDAIVLAATDVINAQGIKGLTFVDVAERVQLNTTSITYYFKRKELLAEAVFEHALDMLDTQVSDALARPDTPARIDRMLEIELDRWAAARRREAQRPARLSDIRAMEEPARTRLARRYVEIMRRVRGFFPGGESDAAKPLNVARTHVLMESIYWIPAWIQGYSSWEFPRVRARMLELLCNGFACPGDQWRPAKLATAQGAAGNGMADGDGSDAGPEAFLRAATRLINERGYRGASVERIASELNVTKGSFYHHLTGKDDLVLACFRRSYERVSQVQQQAAAMDGSDWDRLAAAMSALLHFQLVDEFPLLRTAALQAVPVEMRERVVEQSNRVARRFAGMLIDGIAEGTIRAVDPLIASQMMMAAINSSSELRHWAAGLDPEAAVAIYAHVMAFGMLDAH